MVLLSAAGRWGNGGEYSGMAADTDGAFHPFWADSRTGTFQAWTARVRVQTGTGPTTQGAATAQTTIGPVAEITSSLELVTDPSRYDPATKEIELRIRLKNTSDRTFDGPLTLTIRKFGSGMGD
jgi:hypothetical protein